MSNSSKMPHGFARFIIGDGSAVSEQKNIIWNMIGSFLYAFASMVLSIAVVQLAGEDAGSKLEKALKLGIKIIDEAEFERLLKEDETESEG